MTEIQYAKDEIAQEILVCLMQDYNMTMQQALSTLYNSVLFEKLQDNATGLYFQSPYYCYELLENELKYGKIQGAAKRN